MFLILIFRLFLLRLFLLRVFLLRVFLLRVFCLVLLRLILRVKLRLGLVLGFSCGGYSYKGMYEALDSPDAIREVVKVEVMWSSGVIAEELAPHLSVISRADW